MHWRDDDVVKPLPPHVAERQQLEKLTAWLALPVCERRAKRETIRLRARVQLLPRLPRPSTT